MISVAICAGWKIIDKCRENHFSPAFESINSPLFYVNWVNHRTHSNIHTQFFLFCLSREALGFFSKHINRFSFFFSSRPLFFMYQHSDQCLSSYLLPPYTYLAPVFIFHVENYVGSFNSITIKIPGFLSATRRSKKFSHNKNSSLPTTEQ